MSFIIKFIIIFTSLIAGMLAIILSNRIMRKYRLNYLTSYFYFLTFFFIFSVYSIIGSQSMTIVLESSGADAMVIQSTQAILIALGIPFLVLALYMFMRLSHELFNITLPQIFSISYFMLFALSFIGYALLNIDIGGMEAIRLFLNKEQLTWTFSILLLSVPGYAIGFITIKTRGIKDINQRKSYYWFSAWYTIFILISLISLHLNKEYEIFGLVFISVITGFHLVPVLFINIYIRHYYVEKVENKDFKSQLSAFKEKFVISQRESEIVELICKGMTNKEISDSLFISIQTVKDHVHRIFTKTGVKNRVQLTNLLSAESENNKNQ